MKLVLLMAVVSALWALAGLAAGEEAYPRSAMLLEPLELAKPKVARQFVILDVRPEEEYQLGHVPGARRVDHDAWNEAFQDGRDPQAWSERIGSLGIGAESKVVVYDNKGMKDAARIWWLLRYWGAGDVRLLNGGWQGWQSAALPTSDESPPPAASATFTVVPHRRRLATGQQVLGWLPAGRFQIVDTRSKGEFCGIEQKDNKRAGAIPGAKHFEWSDLIDQQTQRFKSPQQLRRLFNEAGIDLTRPAVTHCQSGGRASVMAFGLELMGAGDVRNYYRGWSEWGNRDDMPVVIPEAVPEQ